MHRDLGSRLMVSRAGEEMEWTFFGG
jgi:hypothetical protein